VGNENKTIFQINRHAPAASCIFFPSASRQRGILKSQFIRFKRIASSWDDYHEASKTLGVVLVKRGYSSRLFRRLELDIWHHFDIKRKNAKESDSGDIMPIITHYDRIQSSLNKEWRSIINKNEIFDKYRKISAYKIHKNLRQLIVRGRLSTNKTNQGASGPTLMDTDDQINISILNSLAAENENYKINRCKHPRCKCCQHITPTDSALSHICAAWSTLNLAWTAAAEI
jgi:hypothetical protein